MTIDVDENELVLLIQLTVKHVGELQRATKNNNTPFETRLLQKLQLLREAEIAKLRKAQG
ncbi:MAG TPA: hypothetical protein VFE61_03595 [Candidatus Sulfotelmatobacter sp.]|nr:hypothetical protein [Candidatus Sulfotelmatobacter sp.]